MLRRLRRMDHQVFRRVADDPSVGHLFVREIHLGLAGPLQSPHANVADHPNDFAIVQAKLEMPSDWLLVGPVSRTNDSLTTRDPLPVHRVSFAHISSRLYWESPRVENNPGVT